MTTQPETHPVLYVQFVTDGPHLHIRKWDFKPFDGGVRYDAQGALVEALDSANTMLTKAVGDIVAYRIIANKRPDPTATAEYVDAINAIDAILAAARGEV